MSIEELEHIIEAILFANGDVISIKVLPMLLKMMKRQ